MPEEKIFIIPLRESKKTARRRRTERAVSIVRKYLVRHMKSEEISLDPSLNRRIWERGAKKPPARIRVKAVKEDDGSVKASLVE